ncbi:MAG: PD-(D/E)XK nuclease family protein [Bacteroidaceae bacterium]|nr:PD-(D/E)XK nuclease family protein [Bacteroidaceae bacterium]
MKPFLSIVAHDLYERCGGDLSKTVVVFPGKRAGLFFNQYLVEEANGRPLFAPTYLTLNELFAQHSDLQTEDPIRLVCLLHRIYVQQTGRDEPLDSFYAWGKLMLSDFDDIDKNNVETKGLFRNLESLEAMSSPEEYLTEEQLNILKHFFGKVKEGLEKSEIKRNFIQVWQVMEKIYDTFHQQLKREGIAYEGMAYRDAIENFRAEQLTAEHYAFVGFNVLNTVEDTFFHLINDTGKALFYWDFDHYYLDNPHHEAGTFIRENLRKFGNALEKSNAEVTEETYRNLQHINKISIVSASSDNAQASFVHDWTKKNITCKGQETAIVLANEKLLQPVLHALPNDLSSDVNVTMGLPITHTRVFPFLTRLIEEKSTVQDNAEWLLTISNEIDAYGSRLKHEENRLQEEEEALYRAHLAVNSLRRIVEDKTLVAGRKLLTSLLLQILHDISVPFHGEPLSGVQVMGVLETRNLDFRNLLILSVNEGMLPRTPSEISFIPYNLRKAFGLTTIERQTSVYAYYFYRLIQRAEHVTLVYNNGTDGLTQQVPSRFISQLLVEFGGPIEHTSLQAPFQAQGGKKEFVIPRTPETRKRLLQKYAMQKDRKSAYLSPSALNDYLSCSLKFWLKNIEGLEMEDENTEDISTAQFGTLFHESAQLAYEKLTERNSNVIASELRSLANDIIAIQKIVDTAFRKKLFKLDEAHFNDKIELDGIHLINFEAIKQLLKQLLLFDAERAPFTYRASEEKVTTEVSLECDGTPITLTLGGKIDRMDEKEGILRIVDYKTGGKDDSFSKLESLFGSSNKKYVFQIFFYSWVLCHDKKNLEQLNIPSEVKISPALLYLKKTANKEYNPTISGNKQPVTDFESQYYKDFNEQLQMLLERIFNSDEPFKQAPSNNSCKYCKFLSLCGRKESEY